MPPTPVETARDVLGGNPTRSLASQTSKYYRNKKRNQAVDKEDAEQEFDTWLHSVEILAPATRKCFNWNTKKFGACTCLAEVDREATAKYMANYCCSPLSSRQIALKGIVQGANVKRASPKGQKKLYKGRFYFVPISGQHSAELCLQSFLNLFGIRTEAWKRLREDVETSGDVHERIIHGNVGNSNSVITSNKGLAEPFVIEFLLELQTNEGAPYATRFIRHITGLGIRDAEVDTVLLPSHYSKRGLFVKFCYGQGKLVKVVDAKGNFGKIEDMADRTDEEWAGQHPGPVCAYSSFHGFWDKHYSKLKIQGRSEDTCNDCHVMANAFRRRQANANGGHAVVNEAEELLLAAAQHVESARAQRKAIQARAREAKASRQAREEAYDESRENQNNDAGGEDGDELFPEFESLTDKQFEELMHLFHPDLIAAAIDCIIIDYAQNMGLPHFGANQPQATYYFTPKSVFTFGVGDVSLARVKLYAYCYQEEHGKKGGNNVASMIVDFLERTGRIQYDQDGNPVKRKRLTIAADNCGGQNKNNHVLRLPLYLVEKGFYEEAEVLFYVKGHTKNVCDRSFNLMKKSYHCRDIMTFDAEIEPDNLVNVLGQAQDVQIVKVVEQDFFKDWLGLQDRLYTKFDSGTITDNHVFSVKASEGATNLTIKTDLTGVCEMDELFEFEKTEMSEQERAAILQEAPIAIPAPGLAEIKQVELYTKWRVYIAEQYRDIIAPKPADDILARIRVEKNKNARRRGRKRRATQQQQQG